MAEKPQIRYDAPHAGTRFLSPALLGRHENTVLAAFLFSRSGGMADAHDSKSCIERCEGSSPSSGTNEVCIGTRKVNALYPFPIASEIFEYPSFFKSSMSPRFIAPAMPGPS